MTTEPLWNDIVKFGQKTLLDTELFTVSWILGRFCNYNCSYCWPYARTDKPDYQDMMSYILTMDSIKSQARDNGFNDFHFSFSGGEPTAFKGFTELLEHYVNDSKPEYQSIHMTTNLSPGSKWWAKWLTVTDSLSRRSITASFHAEHANEQEFGDKCLQLINNGVLLTINQVMVPDHFDEYLERSQRFIDRGINVTLKPQSNTTATSIVEYTEDQLKILKEQFVLQNNNTKVAQIQLEDSKGNLYEVDQAERLNAFGFNQFKGWNCNAGFQGVVIRENEVKRSYSCHEEPLGTMTDGFKLFKEPKKCVTETCISSADSKLPKSRHV